MKFKQVLSQDWNLTCDLQDHRAQNIITSQMKQTVHQQFLANCTRNEAARVAAVGQQSIPTCNPHSQLCPARVPGQDHLDQCPMSLFALMCPFELSNQAFVTCMSICFGVPVPHAQLLQNFHGYSHIDVWGDFLLCDSAHASRSRHVSHNRLAFCLSNLAARAGLASSALQSSVPVATEDTYRKGDILTSVAGLSRTSNYRFSSQTQLITDVTLTHPYSRAHVFNPDSLQDAESLKNRSYLNDYNDQGMAFAPLACNSFGQQASLSMDSSGPRRPACCLLTRVQLARCSCFARGSCRALIPSPAVQAPQAVLLSAIHTGGFSGHF